MTLPAILLSLLIALLIGALYHLTRGGGGWRLMAYLWFSIMGFAAGYLVGAWLGWSLFPLGPLNLGMSGIGSILFLVAGEWLLPKK